jgi:hypothetical protein
MKNIGRVVTTVILAGIGILLTKAANLAASLIAGNASTLQLEDNNASYFMSHLGMSIVNYIPVIGLVVTLLILLVWLKPLKELFSKCKDTTAAAIVLFAFLATSSSAFAYYDRVDNEELVEIGANYTAFMIPMVGANKDAQKQFMSEAFLNDNKVAAKRVKIPHTILHKAGVSFNVFIPASKLFLVDRAPYNRYWVGAKDRGTSGKDESMRFESIESLDASIGVVIGASIKEANSAKYMYNFGTVTKSGDDQVVYSSVVYGRPLSEVMDTIVFPKVQGIIVREFGKYTAQDCVKHKADIIAVVDKEVREYCESRGISLDFVSFAEGIKWENPEVQKAIDSVFIYNMQATAAPARLKMVEIAQKEADVSVTLSKGKMLEKWNGALPTWMMLPKEIWEAIVGFFKGAATNIAHK